MIHIIIVSFSILILLFTFSYNNIQEGVKCRTTAPATTTTSPPPAAAKAAAAVAAKAAADAAVAAKAAADAAAKAAADAAAAKAAVAVYNMAGHHELCPNPYGYSLGCGYGCVNIRQSDAGSWECTNPGGSWKKPDRCPDGYKLNSNYACTPTV